MSNLLSTDLKLSIQALVRSILYGWIKKLKRNNYGTYLFEFRIRVICFRMAYLCHCRHISFETFEKIMLLYFILPHIRNLWQKVGIIIKRQDVDIRHNEAVFCCCWLVICYISHLQGLFSTPTVFQGKSCNFVENYFFYGYQSGIYRKKSSFAL